MTEEEVSLVQIAHSGWRVWNKTEHAEGLHKFLNEWAQVFPDDYPREGEGVLAMREAYVQSWKDGFTKKFGD